MNIEAFFTGEPISVYTCMGEQWLCCYNKSGKRCVCSYHIMTNNMARCQNEKAIRRAMLEAER